MITKIKSILNSEFEVDLFEASLASLNDKGNKLRLNNFAYSIRELSRHFLNSLSPEYNVKNCEWYVPETTGSGKKKKVSDKLTRRDKIRYAIQGGLSDGLLNKLGYDLTERENSINSVLDIIDQLSRYTHIEPEVFYIDDKAVEETSRIILDAFASFVKTINSCKKKVQDSLDCVITGHITQDSIGFEFVNLSELAPHYSLDEIYVDDYNVTYVDDKHITVEVSGSIGITLEWGSRSERAIGDGLDVDKSFPFQTTIIYEIDDSFPLCNFEVKPFDADTSEWWDDAYEDYIESMSHKKI
jgi:hypothetical protein